MPASLDITGNLTVYAPSATVNNNAKVSGTITITDVSENTWNQLTDANKIVFKAQGKTLNIANVQVKELTLDALDALVTIHESATIESPVDIKEAVTIVSPQSIQAIVADGKTVTVKNTASDEGTDITGTDSIDPIIVIDYESLSLGDQHISVTLNPAAFNKGEKIVEPLTVPGNEFASWKIFMTLKNDNTKLNVYYNDGKLKQVYRVFGNVATSNYKNMLRPDDGTTVADTAYVSQIAAAGEYKHVYFVEENGELTSYVLKYEILEANGAKQIKIGDVTYDTDGAIVTE